jgi:hypothetical protein
MCRVYNCIGQSCPPEISWRVKRVYQLFNDAASSFIINTKQTTEYDHAALSTLDIIAISVSVVLLVGICCCVGVYYLYLRNRSNGEMKLLKEANEVRESETEVSTV